MFEVIPDCGGPSPNDPARSGVSGAIVQGGIWAQAGMLREYRDGNIRPRFTSAKQEREFLTRFRAGPKEWKIHYKRWGRK